jgi:hypothetical protein
MRYEKLEHTSSDLDEIGELSPVNPIREIVIQALEYGTRSIITRMEGALVEGCTPRDREGESTYSILGLYHVSISEGVGQDRKWPIQLIACDQGSDGTN